MQIVRYKIINFEPMKESIKFKIFVFSILGQILLFSCANEKKIEKLDGLLERDVMIQIMTDAHTSEGFVDMSKIESIEQVIHDKKAYFNSILKHYNTNDSIFNISFDYYSSNLEDFSSMYDEVIELLTAKEVKYNEEIKAQKDAANQQKAKENQIKE